MWQPSVAATLVLAGTLSMGVAVFNERRMHRHRQPGVTYAQATFRKDGAWRRADIFTPEGLRYQRRASGFGVLGALFWVIGCVAWAVTSS